MNSASKRVQLSRSFAPAVLVHSVVQAICVLKAGEPCTLLSARGAALAAGVAWWQALVAQARLSAPGIACFDILDCADAPGMAMAALRLGQALLVLDAHCPGFAAVARAAQAQGAILLATPPPHLDLARRGVGHRLAAHLRSQSQQMVTSADRDSLDMLR